jgi:rod shape-determining protein MreC
MLRRSTFLLFAVICVGHVLLISAQVQSKSGIPVLQALAFGAFARFQGASGGVADAGRGVWSNYVAVSGAARENEALKRQILELEAELQRQRALAARSKALEETLALKAAVVAPTLAARVIAGSPSPGSDRVTIDRGTSDGVGPDMAVLADRGVVGRVIRPVAAGAATVQLLIGADAAAAVTFERSSAGGVARGGAGSGTLLRVDYAPALADIQPGERVVTSGQDGIYPPGLVVGTVDRIDRPGTAEREILVRPAVDFTHIGLVLVVMRPAPDTESGGS